MPMFLFTFSVNVYRRSAERNRQQLSDNQLRFLRSLEPSSLTESIQQMDEILSIITYTG